MKLYFAGAECQDSTTILDIAGITRRLISFWYVPTQIKERKIKLADYYGLDKDIFVDSGAYTAFTQGTTVDIMEYIEFLKFHEPAVYANLDDISSWEQTLKNQKLMEQAGLKPLPVWHAKEPFQCLKDYVGSYDYVGIGFATLKGSDERKQLAKTLITNFPDKKFHLFALTHLDVLAEYDFCSADSTGWVLRGRKFATIDTPFGYVSFSKEAATESGKFYENMEPKEQAQLDAYLRAFGLSVQDLGSHYRRSWVMRVYYQALYFKLFEQACNDLRKEGVQPTKMLDNYFRSKRRMWQWQK